MAETYNPIRASITGMDGSGKSSAYRAFVEAVPNDLTVVRISRYCSVVRDGKEEVVGKRTSKLLDGFHAWADRTRNKGIGRW